MTPGASSFKVSMVALAARHALCGTAGYTAPITSKNGVIGFGSPLTSCDESRSRPAGPAAFSFAPPVLAARREGSRPAGFRKDVPVFQPVELPPSFGSECVGFCKSTSLEATHG